MIRLPVEPPFHLGATARLLQRRPRNPLDRVEAGRWQRLFLPPAGPVLVQVEQHGPAAAPDLRLTFAGRSVDARERRQLVAIVRRMLGLDVDLAPFRAAAGRIAPLAPLVRRLAGLRPPRFASLYEAFVGVVPFQQVSLDAGVAVFAKIVERFGASATIDGTTWYAAPRPETIARAALVDLRARGLSEAKARTLQNAARACTDGTLDEAEIEHLPSQAARARLLELRGIGPWSADLLLLRGLGRLDAFPPGDVGAARGLGALLGDRARQPERLAAAFAPQQGMLYYLSLAVQLLDRGLIDL